MVVGGSTFFIGYLIGSFFVGGQEYVTYGEKTVVERGKTTSLKSSF